MWFRQVSNTHTNPCYHKVPGVCCEILQLIISEEGVHEFTATDRFVGRPPKNIVSLLLLSHLERTSNHLALVFDPVGPVVGVFQILDSGRGEEEVSGQEILAFTTVALLRVPEFCSEVATMGVLIRFGIIRHNRELSLAEGSFGYFLPVAGRGSR